MDKKPDAGESTSGGKQLDKPTKKPRRKLWRRFIRYEMRKMHERKAERKRNETEEDPERRAARITASATRHIAILTYVLAAVAILTFWELIQGGADTKALVDASRKEARAAEKSARASRDFADTAAKINTGIGTAVNKLNLQAGALGREATQLRRLANAAGTANEQTQFAFEMQTRPRLILEITDFALAKEGGESRMVGIGILYALRNDGASAATEVYANFALSSEIPAPFSDLDWSICKKRRETFESHLGQIPKGEHVTKFYPIPGYYSPSPLHFRGCIAYQMPKGLETYETHVDIRFYPESKDGRLVPSDKAISVESF